MLNVAYLVTAALCSLMAAAGYYMFGNGALDVITFNLSGVLAQVRFDPYSCFTHFANGCGLGFMHESGSPGKPSGSKPGGTHVRYQMFKTGVTS